MLTGLMQALGDDDWLRTMRRQNSSRYLAKTRRLKIDAGTFGEKEEPSNSRSTGSLAPGVAVGGVVAEGQHAIIKHEHE